MRRLAVLALSLLAVPGCGTRIVLTIPRAPLLGTEAPAPRPEPSCCYLNLLVDYSTQASGMSSKEVSSGGWTVGWGGGMKDGEGSPGWAAGE